MMSKVVYRGLVRTPENGGRRSRTLKLDDDSAQVQAKEAHLPEEDERFLQLRYYTEESAWTHQVIDPARPGLAGIIAVGYGDTEVESWEMARKAMLDTTGIEL
jgi:hypothetical protein